MNKLSDRIQVIIELLIEKVNSMKENPKDCVIYTNSIAELYTLLNQTIRLENNIEYYCITNNQLCLLKWEINEEEALDNLNNIKNSPNPSIELNFNEIKFKNAQQNIDKYSHFILSLEIELNVKEYLENKNNINN